MHLLPVGVLFSPVFRVSLIPTGARPGVGSLLRRWSTTKIMPRDICVTFLKRLVLEPWRRLVCGGWSLGFSGSGLQSRTRPRMGLACSLRVRVDAASSQPCWDGGPQWASPSLVAWCLNVPPRLGANSALDFLASGLRTYMFTLLLLVSLLMWP
ncbi:hypothetical protein NDU88_005258 [Pleurodeles waltl]|uniref:Secreted protein n=1 Tax=Pleurodeles waltl TaxID=8319 RepID=A0AAV7QF57_PLEWA|nr:hypothetical protein NDU88_005258 [Pleurodeles waltl]